MGSSQKEECSEAEARIKKYCCSICKTTKTPLWRTGPSGPKSLCNACGIRYRKKHPAAATALGAKNEMEKVKIEERKNMMEKCIKMKMMMKMKKKKKKKKKEGQWNEVERAALLLMALSCGAVFA